MAELVRRKAGSILAIDADPNSCFADMLGVPDPDTIVGICDEISKNMDKIPSGITKERYIEMRVQESLTESKDFDLLVMGAPEGPGCYCYVNNLLRGIIDRITKSYDFVVIDNAAGMEHISRRTEGTVAKLVLVSDYSVSGVRAAKKISDLAKKLKIKVGGSYLIVNRVSGPITALGGELARSGLRLAGEVPYSDAVIERNLSGEPILGFQAGPVGAKMSEIFDKLMES